MLNPWFKKLMVEESALTRAAVRMFSRPGPIAMILLVRDEADIITSNIEFHLRCGIENFVVTDNGSKDGTREILADFERRLGKSIIVLDDAEAAYNQSARVTRMLAIAKKAFHPKWIISADADEFWYPVDGRYSSEMNGAANILKCYWQNFLPRSDMPWQEFTDVGEMPGYHGRIRKLCSLSRSLVGLYSGNHDARAVPNIARDSKNIRVYHYPVRTYQQFERKVVQGYEAARGALYESSAAWHWKEYYEHWQNGRLPEIYADLASRNRLHVDATMSEYFHKAYAERTLNEQL